MKDMAKRQEQMTDEILDAIRLYTEETGLIVTDVAWNYCVAYNADGSPASVHYELRSIGLATGALG